MPAAETGGWAGAGSHCVLALLAASLLWLMLHAPSDCHLTVPRHTAPAGDWPLLQAGAPGLCGPARTAQRPLRCRYPRPGNPNDLHGQRLHL